MRVTPATLPLPGVTQRIIAMFPFPGRGLPRVPLDTPSRLVALLRPHLAPSPQERMLAVLLSADSRYLGTVELGLGDQTHLIASMQSLARGLALALSSAGACRLVLAHNHPSGCLRFSFPDWQLTRRAALITEALGAELLDHLLFVPDGRWRSIRVHHGLSRLRGRRGRPRLGIRNSGVSSVTPQSGRLFP